MRTTLTIDNDISAILARIQHELHLPFKQLINDTLREGLAHRANLHQKKARKRFATRPVSVGEVFIQNLDNIGEVLSASEGDLYK